MQSKEDSSDDEANAPRKGLNSLFAGGDAAKETKAVFGDKVSKAPFKKQKFTTGAHLLAAPKQMPEKLP